MQGWQGWQGEQEEEGEVSILLLVGRSRQFGIYNIINLYKNIHI